jgi:hypothetical protein
MRCEAQDALSGEPNKRLAMTQWAKIRRGKWGKFFPPHPQAHPAKRSARPTRALAAMTGITLPLKRSKTTAAAAARSTRSSQNLNYIGLYPPSEGQCAL